MNNSPFNAVWINPSFLHYRVPVYKELNELLDRNFTLIYSTYRTPETVRIKIKSVLKDKAVGLSKEITINFGSNKENFANRGYKIPFQPGLLKVILDSKPDVIISEGFFQWTPAAVWIKLWKKIPLVITYERTIHTERNAGPLRTFYRRMVIKKTDAICCNGSLSKEYCEKILSMPSDRIVTGAMAADTDELSKRREKLPPDDIDALEKSLGLTRPIFLYVGRLIRLKGLRELLHGWELYVRNSSSTHGSLLLVGEGPEREVLENIIREHNLPNTTFAGAVNYDDIAPYYAVCDAFIIPTLEDNWSLVVPEAMACGKPVLCSNI
jgi:glycosyltransferase involved in cell wall biosynthesis